MQTLLFDDDDGLVALSGREKKVTNQTINNNIVNIYDEIRAKWHRKFLWYKLCINSYWMFVCDNYDDRRY